MKLTKIVVMTGIGIAAMSLTSCTVTATPHGQPRAVYGPGSGPAYGRPVRVKPIPPGQIERQRHGKFKKIPPGQRKKW